MQSNIFDDIRETFRRGSALTKLIFINLGVFLIIKIVYVIYFIISEYPAVYKEGMFHESFLQYLMVPTDLHELVTRPWSIITYMFLHTGFWHIAFNLIAFYFFGRLFLQYFSGKQLITTYLLGGITGAATFVVAYNVFPGLDYGIVLGASGAIMAVLLGVSFYNPNFKLYYPIIGEVKLIYIAVFFILIDLTTMADSNVGGHITHLGGALYGYLFAMQLKKGKDMGKGFSNFIDKLATLFKRRSKLKVTYKRDAKNLTDEDYNQSKAAAQKEIDRILDKIAQSGYESLTKKEKEILFKMSK